jgi:hypothetical protein
MLFMCILIIIYKCTHRNDISHIQSKSNVELIIVFAFGVFLKDICVRAHVYVCKARACVCVHVCARVCAFITFKLFKTRQNKNDTNYTIIYTI